MTTCAHGLSEKAWTKAVSRLIEKKIGSIEDRVPDGALPDEVWKDWQTTYPEDAAERYLAEASEYDRMSPAEYASLWGCDPCYDKSPRQFGDGYLFYNFGSEKPTRERMERFLGAIDRTIAEVEQASREAGWGPREVADLGKLRAHVEGLLQRLS